MQVPPGLLQQRLVPTTSAQERPPAQQFGAAPVAEHATDSPSVQGAGRQVPDWQVSPEQQSPFAAQLTPSGLQQRPDWHCRAPQQPVLAVHAPPALLQQRVAPPAAAQERPLAQHIAVEPSVQDAPSERVHPVGGRQVPDWHVSPAQQSALAAQVCAELRHAQRPAVQSIEPQHSVLDVHAPIASRQQSVEIGDARHDSPSQHALALVQLRDAAVQDVVARPQRPDVQVSPAAQAVPVAQQVCPSAPQVGASQAPATQRAPEGHALPQRPQLRASPALSTHAPPQHASPGPLHELPAQHASPRVPQAIASRAHTPLWQVSPVAQAVPVAQHICPSAPQATRGRQAPDWHAKPVSQRSPSQHVCPSAPQGGTASQRALAQRKPLEHTSPAQHISPAPPQLTGGRQRPSRHTSAAAQLDPSQQAWLSAPHIGEEMHTPPMHVSPCSQASPEQHDCPWVPQSGCGISSSGPESMPPLPLPASMTPSSGSACAQPRDTRSTTPSRRNPARRSITALHARAAASADPRGRGR